ncbi:hypothetical protein [Catenovulum agarivorans]|uniref:hypothetical protein n=1 Tax=Catenovulum agarivorans TaxID=1172192 RepID=UPI0003698A4C|nr:hypothetical protein [Catenovulum agarivorans]
MSLIKNENCSRFALVFVNICLGIFPCAAQHNMTTSGYAEIAHASDASLLKEFRAEYATEYSSEHFSASICAEIFVDRIFDETTPDWCELFVRFENEQIAVTLGRQTLNWGLGQYFYVNDLFAKDWQSPAIGRDKGDIDDVNDGAQVTAFNILGTELQFDWVWAKFFAANTYADEGRIKVTEQQSVQLAAEAVDKSEHMLRLSQQSTGVTWALFYHLGYQKQPQFSDGNFKHNKLKHFGVSVTTHISVGEVGVEIGHTAVAQASDQNKYLIVFAPEFFANASKHFLRLQWLKDNRSNWMGVEYQYNFDHKQTLALTNLFSTEQMSSMLMAHYNLTFSQYWVWEFGVNLFKGNDVGAQWDYYADSSSLYSRLRYQL